MYYLLSVFLPIVTGIIIAVLKLKNRVIKISAIMVSLATECIFTSLALLRGGHFVLADLGNGIELSFFTDKLGAFFAIVILSVWVIVTVYTFVYIKHEGSEDRFFAFMLIALGAMLGICYASNLITMYLFFETATLTSMPLVLHSMTKEAINAALKYLFYSIAGALLGLLGIFFITYYSNGYEFVAGGSLELSKISNGGLFLFVVFLTIVGFGTKAGIYPMHNWLPVAHPVAPAPASALLSGIITKAGVIAIIRIVYFSIGFDYIKGTWVQYAWLSLALLTVFMGSMMAYREKVLKKRLAYSSVSNLSYILAGLACLSPEALTGSLFHVLAHASAKCALFLAAGAIIYKFSYTSVDQLKGIGKRMPVTMWCFTIASLSLIGIPPLSGFVSKWYLAEAAIFGAPSFFSWLMPVILLISALLTAGYLLPVTISAFFPGKDSDDIKRDEASFPMTIAMSLLCIATLAVGLFGSALLPYIEAVVSSAFPV